MPSNKSNKRCASFSGNGFAVKDGQNWRDEPQASQVIKSAGCARPHGGNRDCETACQHASAQCVSSLGDRCELKGHIWPVNFSQEERSGFQPGFDTYRCLIRCHPQRRGQQCCNRILSDSRSSAAKSERGFAQEDAILFFLRGVAGQLTLYWGQVYEIKIMAVFIPKWIETWHELVKPTVGELTEPNSQGPQVDPKGASLLQYSRPCYLQCFVALRCIWGKMFLGLSDWILN